MRARTGTTILSALIVLAGAGFVYVSRDEPVVVAQVNSEPAAVPDTAADYQATAETSGIAVFYELEKMIDGVRIGQIDTFPAIVGDSLVSFEVPWEYGAAAQYRIRGYYWGLVDGKSRKISGPWSDWSDPVIDAGPPPGQPAQPGITARARDPKDVGR